MKKLFLIIGFIICSLTTFAQNGNVNWQFNKRVTIRGELRIVDTMSMWIRGADTCVAGINVAGYFQIDCTSGVDSIHFDPAISGGGSGTLTGTMVARRIPFGLNANTLQTDTTLRYDASNILNIQSKIKPSSSGGNLILATDEGGAITDRITVTDAGGMRFNNLPGSATSFIAESDVFTFTGNFPIMQLRNDGISTPFQINFYDGTNNLLTGIRAAASQPTDYVIELPDSIATAGQVLTADAVGGGVITSKWRSVSSGGGTVTSVTATLPLVSSGGTTPNITTHFASATDSGAVHAADWTTFNNKIGTLNGLTGAAQTFAVGTTGTDFNISSSGTTHNFNIPSASLSNRGLVTTGTQTFNGNKTINGALTLESTSVFRGVQYSFGSTVLGASTYRTTNGGTDITPRITIGSSNINNRGLTAITLDSINYLGFNVTNGTRHVLGASIQLTDTASLAGSETGGLGFFTKAAATAAAQRMTILNSGNVGIGTTNPLKVFHTVGTVRHVGTDSASTSVSSKPVVIDANGDMIKVISLGTGQLHPSIVYKTQDSSIIVNSTITGTGSILSSHIVASTINFGAFTGCVVTRANLSGATITFTANGQEVAGITMGFGSSFTFDNTASALANNIDIGAGSSLVSSSGTTNGIIVPASDLGDPIVVDLSAATSVDNCLYEVDHVATGNESGLAFRKGLEFTDKLGQTTDLVASQIADGTAYPSLYRIDIYANVVTDIGAAGQMTIDLAWTDGVPLARTFVAGTLNLSDQFTQPVVVWSGTIYATGAVNISTTMFGIYLGATYDLRVVANKLPKP